MTLYNTRTHVVSRKCSTYVKKEVITSEKKLPVLLPASYATEENWQVTHGHLCMTSDEVCLQMVRGLEKITEEIRAKRTRWWEGLRLGQHTSWNSEVWDGGGWRKTTVKMQKIEVSWSFLAWWERKNTQQLQHIYLHALETSVNWNPSA